MKGVKELCGAGGAVEVGASLISVSSTPLRTRSSLSARKSMWISYDATGGAVAAVSVEKGLEEKGSVHHTLSIHHKPFHWIVIQAGCFECS